MKDSLKKFREYNGSKRELMYRIRIYARWDEDSFLKMQQITRAVIKDYAGEDDYPKEFVLYFMREIPSIINMLSHFEGCTEEELQAGYTVESYLSMISDRIEQIEKLRWEFIYSLSDNSLNNS